MKLQYNRSLNEFKIQQHRFQQERNSSNKLKISFVSSPNINLNNISTTLSNLSLNSTPKQFKSNKNSICSHSHSKLEGHSIKFQATSHNQNYTQIKTSRAGSKYNQNIEINPFEMNKYIKANEQNFKILTPSNRNICVEEPKRPKILKKQKHISFFDEFKLGRVLGKGKFGNVYIAQHIPSKFIVAVKQISLAKVSTKLIERLIYQIKIQSFLKHENCLQLLKFYKQGTNLYLILELGQSSLFDKLRVKKYFKEEECVYYISQVIKAFIYLHSNNIIHRDLKPQNIVLINDIVKLADFGWSIYLNENQKRNTFCGTLDYVSPEIVQGEEYDKAIDVWSIGVLCYELCTGHAPFQSKKGRQQIYKKIKNVEIKFPHWLSNEVKQFILKLLNRNPSDRMSLQDALNHPWIKKYSTK